MNTIFTKNIQDTILVPNITKTQSLKITTVLCIDGIDKYITNN